MESKYSKFLTILLIVIIIGVIGLLGYIGYDYLKTDKNDKDMAQFVDDFSKDNNGGTTGGDNSTGADNSTVNQNEIIVDGGNSNTSGKTKKKRTYKGFNVLGTIEIPKTGMKGPVLEKPTISALETSVAVLYPQKSDLNIKGNVVIVGHNYRNGKFFSNNKKLSNGDKIYITDLYDEKITYVVYKTFETSEEDTSFYNRDTNGAREITLSTCTDDSKARTIVLAKEAK